MNFWVTQAVPYAADLLKNALVEMLFDKKKAQDSLIISDEVSSR